MVVAVAATTGSIELYGNEIFFRINEAEGLPIVVIGDGPGISNRYLEDILPARKTVFYDSPGIGKSSNAGSLDLSVEYYISELSAIVHELELERFHLVGHGFGSLVAVYYALARPAGLSSLVLVNPILSIPQLDLLLEEHALQNDTEPDKLKLLFLNYRGDIEAKLKTTVEDVCRDTYNQFWGDGPVVTGKLRGLDISSGLSDLRMPILICTGLYIFPGVDKIIDYQKLSPTSEFVTFINSAHFPMLEESEGFNMIVGDFLRRVEAEHENSPAPNSSGKAVDTLSGVVSLGEKDNGVDMDLEVGRDFSVSLPSSPGTGYSWKLEEFDGRVLRLLSDPFYEEPGTTGGGYQVFQFRVIGPGEADISLSYCSCWNDEPIRTYRVGISVPLQEREALSIDESGNGKSFSVDLAVPLEVSLNVTTGTGMSWRITSTTSSILRQTKENEYSIPENTPAVGGTVQQRYYFEGINYGTAYIEFSYGRPWEEAPPERTFGATITVAEPVHNIYVARDSDHDRYIALELDQMLILKLKSGSSSDETWYLREGLPRHLQLLVDPFIEYVEEVGYSIFYFKTVERGEVVLEMSYGSPASPDQPIDTYRITLQIE